MIPSQKSNVVDLHGTPRETRAQVLERLFREHGAPLRGFLWARLGQDHELDDVVQEVFAKLATLDGLQERLPVGNDSNRAFIFTMANNLVLNQEKHRQVQQRYAEQQRAQVLEGNISVESPPEVVVLARQELDKVKAVIMAMRPNWQKAFVLSRFKHKSYKQIATEMGVSVKQVEKYMKQALIRVRRAGVELQGAEQ